MKEQVIGVMISEERSREIGDGNSEFDIEFKGTKGSSQVVDLPPTRHGVLCAGRCSLAAVASAEVTLVPECNRRTDAEERDGWGGPVSLW